MSSSTRRASAETRARAAARRSGVPTGWTSTSGACSGCPPRSDGTAHRSEWHTRAPRDPSSASTRTCSASSSRVPASVRGSIARARERYRSSSACQDVSAAGLASMTAPWSAAGKPSAVARSGKRRKSASRSSRSSAPTSARAADTAAAGGAARRDAHASAQAESTASVAERTAPPYLDPHFERTRTRRGRAKNAARVRASRGCGERLGTPRRVPLHPVRANGRTARTGVTARVLRLRPDGTARRRAHGAVEGSRREDGRTPGIFGSIAASARRACPR